MGEPFIYPEIVQEECRETLGIKDSVIIFKPADVTLVNNIWFAPDVYMQMQEKTYIGDSNLTIRVSMCNKSCKKSIIRWDMTQVTRNTMLKDAILNLALERFKDYINKHAIIIPMEGGTNLDTLRVLYG